ncbi:MAG TPA: cation diffusion facilitator family transporter [Mycobacteriales bacterium]|nr:cation diffusion facilitator family transporter [Mycobacteriales bacterium]
MGHDHSHSHAHGLPRGRLAVVLAITVGVLAVEVVGALLAGSLALLADAGHMATDAIGIALTLVAVTAARRPPSPSRSFGSRRFEVLSAVVNALLLAGVGAYVIVEGINRLVHPTAVESGIVAIFGAVGMAGNACSALLLARDQAHSIGMRGAFLEVVADGLASAAVLIAAGIIALTGWTRVDPIASLTIAAFILPRTWKLLREAVEVLLEATPKHLDPDEIRRHILAVDGVLEVHDLHAWQIVTDQPLLSAHVVVDSETIESGAQGQILDQLGDCLSSHFDIGHCTFQVEPVGHREHEGTHHA